MFKNNSLVPATITDKNGKVTTVHKKPQKAAVVVSMPSPSLPVQETSSPVRLTVTARIIELYDATHVPGGFDYRTYLKNDMQHYSESTLRAIDLALKDDGKLAESVAEHIVHGVDESVLRETLHYHQRSGSDDYLRTASEIRALGNYPVVSEHEDLSIVDEQTQKQCLALMRFSRLIDTPQEFPSPFLDYVDNESYDSRVINSESLVALIAQRPDDVDKIAEIVLKYRTSNGAAVHGIMEGALPTTAEGYL
jgi:hypothetical protein